MAVMGVLLASHVSGASSASRAPSHVRTVENYADRPSVVVLDGGKRFETTLYEVKILGELRTERKLPYLAMAGRGCPDCDANAAIYIHSPSDGPMRGEASQPRYMFPGREVFYEDGKLLYEARVFIGACLPGHDNAVVWHQRERTKRNDWLETVFVAGVRHDRLATRGIEAPNPSLSDTLELVRVTRCREIPGTDRSSEP